MKEIPASYDAKRIEEEVNDFWRDEEIYKRVRSKNECNEKFFFVDGPPYTTGSVHLGIAWNKIIKDCVLRYKSMEGFHLLDKPGWDMHGLPIEVKVEENLGFRSKKEIEEYGVDRFVQRCMDFAISNKEKMTEQFRRLGVWLDWENPYMTIREEHIEAAWWTLKKAYENNLLEKGERVISWCPRCETAIAESEIDYSEMADPSIYVLFPVDQETFIVVWTTTPWTIPANVAVAVHPSIEYAKVRAHKGDRCDVLILASDLIESVTKEGGYDDYEMIERVLGNDLVGLRYRHPLADVVPKQEEFVHRVYAADFVTTENTGCVHIAPGHGPDDFELGKREGLPIFCPVMGDGRFDEDAGKYAGKEVRSTNSEIISDLDERGLLLHSEMISHRYGHCWRCNTPILYLTTEQWFLGASKIKEEMLREVDKISWYPEWAGKSRFYDWIRDARDWCISRQRYWGIPIPVWTCDCGRMEVIGTIEELREKSGFDGNPHIPFIERAEMICECGKRMERVKDVFDVWFDSGVASWATLGFPREKDAFEGWWPADFITEGHDQTRGWFYSQLVASMIVFGKAPYRSVLVHGFALDRFGRKMSKSLGNVITPEEVIDRYGADALRLYVLSANAPWEDLRFSWNEVENVSRMLNILWNVYRFPLPYMALDDFDPERVNYADVAEYLRPEDRWILSRCNTTIAEVSEAMDRYELHVASRKLNAFILDDLSRWYIPLIRPRTWKEEENYDKLAAYYAIYEVLHILTRLLSPFVPFFAEKVYQSLIKGIDALSSVHMCEWPVVKDELVNKDLEKEMEIVRDVVEAAKNARQKGHRKLRWPVKRIIVSPEDEITFKAVNELSEIIREEVNAKRMVLLGVGEKWGELKIEISPIYSKIGPKFKKKAKDIVNALEEVDPRIVRGSNGYEILGELITEDMIDFREKVPDGVFITNFGRGVVYVDTELTEEIESESFAREIIRRVQDMRKEMNLEVTEEIDVRATIEDERVVKLLKRWNEFISNETRARELKIGTEIKMEGYVKEWVVEGMNVRLSVSKIL